MFSQGYYNVRFHLLAAQHRLSRSTAFIALPVVSLWGTEH